MFHLRRYAITALRIGMGWLFFYAGITKVLNPAWSALPYISSAKSFAGFYQWLSQPEYIGLVNQMNMWGLTLLGVSLILGAGVRISSIFGAVLMLLYYFPVLSFPYPNAHSFIVDEHIIYALVLIFFSLANVGKIYGLDGYLARAWKHIRR